MYSMINISCFGLIVKHDIEVGDVIDSDCGDEVKVILFNHLFEPFIVKMSNRKIVSLQIHTYII